MTTDAFLFDLDGTLLDSITLIVESFHHTRRVHFGDALPDAFWRAGIGTTLRDQFGKMARSDTERDAMVETYKVHNLAHHDEFVRTYEGATEVVQALRAQGKALAIVTSKMREGTERGLRFLGLEDTFDAVVCADDVTHGKPDPEPVQLALSLLKVEATRAVFVGDSPHDMASGKAAGVKTLAALWGPFTREALEETQPDGYLTSPEEILRYV